MLILALAVSSFHMVFSCLLACLIMSEFSDGEEVLVQVIRNIQPDAAVVLDNATNPRRPKSQRPGRYSDDICQQDGPLIIVAVFGHKDGPWSAEYSNKSAFTERNFVERRLYDTWVHRYFLDRGTGGHYWFLGLVIVPQWSCVRQLGAPPRSCL